jgi:hypothetical protein
MVIDGGNADTGAETTTRGSRIIIVTTGTSRVHRLTAENHLGPMVVC